MTKHWHVTDATLQASLADAAEVLRAGGLVAYPTDTLYGLAADPWNPEAIRKVFAIKRRDLGVALPLVAADLAQVEACVAVLPADGRRLAAAFWPGPLALVIPAPASLPAEVLGATAGVAVRVPAHAVAAGLAHALGRPIVATSANVSGASPTADPAEVARTLGSRLDGLLDGGLSPGGPPSTIVDVRGTPRLVRAGAIAWERVVQFLAS